MVRMCVCVDVVEGCGCCARVSTARRRANVRCAECLPDGQAPSVLVVMARSRVSGMGDKVGGRWWVEVGAWWMDVELRLPAG